MADTHKDKPVTPFRVLIVEDESMIGNRLVRLFSELLSARQMQPEVAIAASLSEAKQALQNSHYHLISLDLNLSGDSGFELLQHACCSAAQCIVVSAYREQALTGFEYGVLDFVAKPFSRQRLDKALSRAMDDNAKAMDNVTKYLLVKNGGSILRLLLSDIESVSGYGNYSQLHLQNGIQHLHEMGLDALLKILPPSFLRVHKSHILNLDKFLELTSLGGGQYQLRTQSGSMIPVGRSKVQELKQRLSPS